MKKLLTAFICLLAAGAAFSEGNQETDTEGGSRMREFDYKGFTVVQTGFGIDVKIVQSQSYSVVLFADEDIMDRIVIEASGRTLRIGRRWELFTFGWSRKARVEISMPRAEGLEASGGSRIEVSMNDPSSRVIVHLSGGSSIVGNLTSDHLEIDSSGGSSAEIAGAASVLRLSGSGGSRFRMAGCPARDLDADLSGGSWVEGTASGSLTVKGSGGSHVTYHGDARVERQSLSGGSWIKKE